MKKRISSFILSILMVFNISVFYPQVALAYASAFAYQDALIPIETFATAVAIGSGIVASQNAEAIKSASGVIAKAIANVKAKACGDTSTAFRVIKNGKSEKPESGDDKNNNKWFVRGAAAIGIGKLVADLSASKQMMESINNNSGYNLISSKTGIISIQQVMNECGAEAIRKKIVYDGYRGFVGAWDTFCKKFVNDGYNLKDYFYCVTFPNNSITFDEMPKISVTCYKASKNISYIKLGVANYKIMSIPIYYQGTETHITTIYATGNIARFFNDYDVGVPTEAIQYDTSYNNTYKLSSLSVYNPIYNFGQQYGYWGLDSYNYNAYELTNNTYKAGQSTAENFPDWVQSSIETINGNLEAINLAINNLKLSQTWGDTQPNIQTGTAPSNVINQYINNWSNPETAPDPGENPEPGPDPEPDPNPQPTPEPAPTDDYLQGFMLPATITEKFPFCVPFDIAKCLKLFSVSGREAPKWEGTIKYGVKGENEYKVSIDLKDFEPIAKIVRPLEFIVFLVGLIIVTRDLIKG